MQEVRLVFLEAPAADAGCDALVYEPPVTAALTRLFALKAERMRGTVISWRGRATPSGWHGSSARAAAFTST